ncbi:uncharacterized protein LOC131995624 [Stomoxys calcitrans]|uniref:uncharacterized protein LOC131995624 n=1 Tax=Stomoxys calcitrans TaxID=35570 RepID=UPI0027E3A023|nr:uncharacterized protein LOC131995624 [Stomoxys calcitrans]
MLGEFERKILRKIYGPVCVNGEHRRRMNHEKYDDYSNGWVGKVMLSEWVKKLQQGSFLKTNTVVHANRYDQKPDRKIRWWETLRNLESKQKIEVLGTLYYVKSKLENNNNGWIKKTSQQLLSGFRPRDIFQNKLDLALYDSEVISDYDLFHIRDEAAEKIDA